jgi:hypothetical protein
MGVPVSAGLRRAGRAVWRAVAGMAGCLIFNGRRILLGVGIREKNIQFIDCQ